MYIRPYICVCLKIGIFYFMWRFFQDNDETKGTCLRDQNNMCAFEVRTAPIQDGVLPGIIRQIVME